VADIGIARPDGALSRDNRLHTANRGADRQKGPELAR